MGRTYSMHEMRNVYNIYIVNSEGKRPLGDVGVGGRITLICLNMVWIGFTGSG
jgi:hypothetical protein